MICLTLHQPYASASVLELKPWETRGYRFGDVGGLIAVHAGHGVDLELAAYRPLRAKLRAAGLNPDDLPAGAILGVMRVVDVKPTAEPTQLPGLADVVPLRELSPLARRLGDFGPGRFGWRWELERRLEVPLTMPGMPGLWHIDDRILEAAS